MMTVPPIPMTLAGIGGLGPWELVIILVIVLLIFGAGKLPTIGSSLGQALKNFKKGIKGGDSDKEKKP